MLCGRVNYKKKIFEPFTCISVKVFVEMMTHSDLSRRERENRTWRSNSIVRYVSNVPTAITIIIIITIAGRKYNAALLIVNALHIIV